MDPPWQTELLPVIAQEGAEPTVMVLLQLLLHPLLLVMVTVYVPEAVTVMQRDVAPVLHE